MVQDEQNSHSCHELKHRLGGGLHKYNLDSITHCSPMHVQGQDGKQGITIYIMYVVCYVQEPIQIGREWRAGGTDKHSIQSLQSARQ